MAVGCGVGTVSLAGGHQGPSCPRCRALRGNVDSVEKEFTGRIQFRIANIRTSKGRALASRYDVPHITLLLFDGDGELVNVLRGVRSPDELRPSFKTLL